MNESDVVIVGGGAAGSSAALVLARARRTVAVVDAGAPRNAPASHTHGFLSRDGDPPASLLATGRDECSMTAATSSSTRWRPRPASTNGSDCSSSTAHR